MHRTLIHTILYPYHGYYHTPSNAHKFHAYVHIYIYINTNLNVRIKQKANNIEPDLCIGCYMSVMRVFLFAV